MLNAEAKIREDIVDLLYMIIVARQESGPGLVLRQAPI